ncbi:hypothetical protein [Streptomyces indicus]|uniref:MYXO-CTERM domain-containing protein n=1 Tax=Streptomyces indicus TaxID=417292 RepID=A0A1G9DSX2_9ACTN|nr:hypothetical protein [Streptomyces indicus]SDK66978.1 hypothetical protein SAMN05421806_11036 [Streptomyces indicus]
MPSARVRVTLAATVAALALTTPALAADGTVKVTPGTATPGSQVELTATGCDGTTGAAKSQVFVADAALTGRDGAGYSLTGEAMIRSTATPGTYDVSVTCDGETKAKGTVTVVTQVTPTPTAPIRAGGGGTAQLSAEDTGGGPGWRHALIGLLLATAAGLAVTGRLVRRRRGGA